MPLPYRNEIARNILQMLKLLDDLQNMMIPNQVSKNIHNVERVIFYFLHVCFQPR